MKEIKQKYIFKDLGDSGSSGGEEQNCGEKIRAPSIIKFGKHSNNVKNCTFKNINKGHREKSINNINVIKRRKFWSSP